MKTYIKQVNPEFVDYDIYFDELMDGDNELIIKESRDFKGFNDDILKSIKQLYNEYGYYDYEVYYDNSIKAYVNDYIKKENGKKFSPTELHTIKFMLDKDENFEDFELTVLSMVKGKQYVRKALRGYSQGDYVELYCPENTSNELIDTIENLYFGGGMEVIVNDGDNEVSCAEDIDGYSMFLNDTQAWNVKEYLAEALNVNKDDIVFYK